MAHWKVNWQGKTLIFALLSITLFHSCVKNEIELDSKDNQQWKPDIAVPLVFSSLSIADILRESDKGGNIKVGSDKFCTLIYFGELFSVKASDLIILPNQQYSTNVGFGIAQAGSFNTQGTATINSSQNISYNTGGPTQIDSVKFKPGSMLNISISPSFNHSGKISIAIPSAKKNGQIFSGQINYANTAINPITAAFDMGGYVFDMSNGGTTTNQIAVNYTLTLTNTGSPVTVADNIRIQVDFNNQKFDRIFGYVGQQFLSPDKDTVLIKIFNNSYGGGTFTLVDPKVKVIISNSYGVPIRANFTRFYSWKPPASMDTMSFVGTPNPIPIKSPTIAQIGQTAVDSFQLTKSNSNIVPVINNTPKYVIYELNSTSNPQGKISQNFILDSSRFKVDMEIELPLYGTAKNFTMQDTLDMAFETVENVETFLFRVYVNNAFPVDMDVQAYFADSNNKILDSLISPYQMLIPSGVVSPVTDRVVSATERITDCSFSADRVKKLEKTKKLIIKGKANTYSGGTKDIKIYADDKMDIRIGVRAKLKVNF